jgi:hypothetical protein
LKTVGSVSARAHLAKETIDKKTIVFDMLPSALMNDIGFIFCIYPE